MKIKIVDNFIEQIKSYFMRRFKQIEWTDLENIKGIDYAKAFAI